MTTLNQIVSAFGSLIMVLDKDRRFVDVHNSDTNSLLKPLQEVLGIHYTLVLPEELSYRLGKYLDKIDEDIHTSINFEYELEINTKPEWFNCTLRQLMPSPEHPNGGYLALISNITDMNQQRLAIHHKEQLLFASANANVELLSNRDIIQATSFGVRELGTAMKADRCYMFEAAWSEQLQEDVLNQRFEWSESNTKQQIDNPQLQNIPFSKARPFLDPLLDHKPFLCMVHKLPESELKLILQFQSIKSLLALPIFVQEKFWGFVGFDDCRYERMWSSADISILASFASSIANAVIRRQIEDDLVKVKNEAEIANKAKSVFLSNITHEIRTPLHGVIGNTQMLLGHRFEPPEDEYFQNLRLSANILYELINNILDISRIEAGVFDFNPEIFLLEDVLNSVKASVSCLLRTSSNVLETMFDPVLPQAIYFCPILLNQVLVNLLSNAIKFTHCGRIVLSVRQVEAGLRFSVEDNGIGFSEEQKSRLFLPFTQFDSSFSKQYQGTGLGLYITKNILHQTGIQLEVHSLPGKGSTFTFILPWTNIRVIKRPDEGAEPSVNLVLDHVQEVLIVEDNRINMMLAERMINDLFPSVVVHKAFDGLEALRLLEEGLEPNVILMDLQMPLLDGFETTRRIRKMNSKSVPTIIALTASATTEIKEHCLEVGMNDFLSKPYSREQISRLLMVIPPENHWAQK